MARRQPNNRPSIYLGADGKWHCYISVGTKNGKPDRRHREGRTATEVGEKIDELLRQVAQRGAPTTGKIETVGDWLLYWVENVVKPNRAWKTYAGYKSLISTHVVPVIGGWKLDGRKNRLEPEHVEALYAKMRTVKLAATGKPAAASYILQAHRILHKAFKDAIRRGRASRNVCDMIDPPQHRARKINAHTLAEAEKIVEAALADPLAPRWLLGMFLGPRQGEVLGLRWSAVELDPAGDAKPHMRIEKQLQRRTWEHGCDDPAACAREHCRTEPCRQVCPDHRGRQGCTGGCRPRCTRHRRACPPPCKDGCTDHARSCPQRAGGGLLEVDLKTQQSERDLPLPPAIVELLRRHRAEQQRIYRMQGIEWSRAGRVFATNSGTPIDPKADHAAWERLLVAAGVADSRLHAARHSAGTLMTATGTDIAIVQETLGHSNIATTKGYVDVALSVKGEAVERAMAAIMDGRLTELLQRDGATGKPAG